MSDLVLAFKVKKMHQFSLRLNGENTDVESKV